MIIKKNFPAFYSLALLATAFFCFASPAFAVEQFEHSQNLKASSFLPEKFLKTDLYTIEDIVKNDGFTNTYTVYYGKTTFPVSSNIALFKLIQEIEAIEAMKKVQQSDAFVDALKDSGTATVEGLKNLFTDPVNTIDSAVTGVGSLFSRAEESIFNSSPGESEDSRIEQTVGFSSAKRDVAYRYKVDVYSKNPVLQEHLDRIAWAEYAGGLTLSVATMPLGGAAGLTLSVSGTARLLGELIATIPPAELKLQNRTKLSEMGIDESLASLFIDNPHFSPLQQTAYVMALEKMKSATERSLPLQVALQVNDQNMARYMTAVMVMFAGYNEKISPIIRFKVAARFFCGVNKDGKLIIILPADYITANKRLAGGISSVTSSDMTGYELWSIGTASAKAKELLKDAGWKFQPKAAGKIGFVMNKKR